MKKKISILGCGWLGKALAIELIKNNYSVKGSTTSRHKIDELKSIGIQSHLINISEFTLDSSEFLKSDCLIIAITSKQSDDFKQLITLIEHSTIKEIIFVSSTSVYTLNNSVVTEASAIQATPLSKIESLFIDNNNLKTTIIRFGGLFGYDRQPQNFFKNDTVIKSPEGYINFIHRDDCIGIIEQLINQGISHMTLNACSGSHPKRREFYTNAFKKAGRPEPLFNENSINDYKIINSDKLISLLGYTFKYNDLINY